MLFHGVGFEQALGAGATATSLVRGPWSVLQNRLRGPELGVHVIAAPDQAGVAPADVAGYFADPRWLRLNRGDAALVIRNAGATPYLQLGARLADLPSTSVGFPAGALGFLHAIPAMGAKFHPGELTGPAASLPLGRASIPDTCSSTLLWIQRSQGSSDAEMAVVGAGNETPPYIPNKLSGVAR